MKTIVLTAVTVLFGAGCVRDATLDRDAGVDVTNEANISDLTNSLACTNLRSSDYASYGCYCGPSNYYWTGGLGGSYDSCNPLGGVQLDGPSADATDECCKVHDNCYYDAWKANHLCNCGSYNPFDPSVSYSHYSATCVGRVAPTDGGAGTPGTWTCGDQTGDTQDQIACRQACCACDATISGCFVRNRGTYTPDLGRSDDNCPPVLQGSSGQRCSGDEDCTIKPWPESWQCDGGTRTAYVMVCQEGWCYRSCGDRGVCPYPRNCSDGSCAEY